MENKQLLQQIIELTHHVNASMFNGELNINFPIKLSNTSKAAGQVHFNTLFGQIVLVREMKISKNFNWTEQELISVIAHELIHIWEIQILKKRPSHGSQFLAKMNELNQTHNAKINVKHSMKTTKVPKSKKIHYVISEDKRKFLPIAMTALFNMSNERLEKTFGPNYKMGTIDSNQISTFKVSRRIRFTYKMTPEKALALGL